jgi:hypothetical protein
MNIETLVHEIEDRVSDIEFSLPNSGGESSVMRGMLNGEREGLLWVLDRIRELHAALTPKEQP